MKSLIGFITILLLPILLPAQSTAGDYEEWLNVGVYMPRDKYDDLEYEQINKLETKIISVISRSGVTSKISAFRLSPGIDSSSILSDDHLLKFLGKGVVCTPKLEI